jgi:endogenous inhibitor of DNA gyrase (YacG/DUF329 family)
MSARSPEEKMMQAGPKCPICGKSQDAKLKPFCSKRCADVDLSRWLKGSYAIPAEEDPEDGIGLDEGGEEG